MTNTNNKQKCEILKIKSIIAIILIVVFVLAIIATVVCAFFFKEHSTMFSVIGALFSAVATAFVGYAVFWQNKQFKKENETRREQDAKASGLIRQQDIKLKTYPIISFESISEFRINSYWQPGYFKNKSTHLVTNRENLKGEHNPIHGFSFCFNVKCPEHKYLESIKISKIEFDLNYTTGTIHAAESKIFYLFDEDFSGSSFFTRKPGQYAFLCKLFFNYTIAYSDGKDDISLDKSEKDKFIKELEDNPNKKRHIRIYYSAKNVFGVEYKGDLSFICQIGRASADQVVSFTCYNEVTDDISKPYMVKQAQE